MPKLYHHWLSPFCRKVRIALGEKAVDCTFELEPAWERRDQLLLLNPAGTVPVFVDDNDAVIPESSAICEYLEETRPGRSLLGNDAVQRAETRRLVAWFDDKFNREVTAHLYGEKVIKRYARTGEPNSAAMRAGRANLRYHLDYIAWLADRRNWLAGDELSYADLAAAAHLSVLDYLGDVPWDEAEEAKLWYQRIKSRPSFRPLLADQAPGFRPARHYSNLDF